MIKGLGNVFLFMVCTAALIVGIYWTVNFDGGSGFWLDELVSYAIPCTGYLVFGFSAYFLYRRW